jgi:hypothetical protein
MKRLAAKCSKTFMSCLLCAVVTSSYAACWKFRTGYSPEACRKTLNSNPPATKVIDGMTCSRVDGEGADWDMARLGWLERSDSGLFADQAPYCGVLYQCPDGYTYWVGFDNYLDPPWWWVHPNCPPEC